MLIVCPNCATSYKVEGTHLGSEGRTVRCARCKVTWFAAATASTHALALMMPAMADAADDHITADDVMRSTDDTTAMTVVSPDPFPHTDSIESDSPPLVPVAAGEDPPEDEPSDDIETVAAKRQAQLVTLPPPRPARRPRLAFYIPVLLAIIVAAMAGRTHLVRHFPQSASLFAAIGLPVNLRGLEFSDVIIANDTENNVPVMIVQGKIRNITTHKVAVPQIRFGVQSNTNVEIYAWTAPPEKTSLGSGETLSFRSQLASPPTEAKTVAVRFVNQHDRTSSR
jgi:predicted Zn finger-like uncharacterized protein